MKQEIAQKIAEAAKSLFNQGASVELLRPDEQFGDYATNVALQLGNKLKQNPREIAEKLVEKLRGNLAENISEVSVAGPGFINLKLSDKALLKNLDEGPAKPLSGKKILAEYSNPNPFKPLHAGHLYATLLGDSLAYLLEAGGADVVRLSYGGDVGRHVGITMWAIIKNLGGEYPEKLNEIPEKERAKWLGERYVEGTKAFEEDETAKPEIIEANKKVYQLHEQNEHGSPFAQIYWTCRQWSYDYFKVLYKELEVHEFDRLIPESEVTPLGVKTVREQLAKGVYEESEGAIIFDGEKYGLHKRVFINSEGIPTYEAKDVGDMLMKWRDYHYDLSYYINASEQAEYFQVMFKSVEQFDPEPARRARSISFGLVKLAGGVKMSSRKGNVLNALDVLEAAARANLELSGKPNKEVELAAVKYAFLKNRIGSDIVYDPKESVALEGNSGPYIQYAHARARSILAKAGERNETVIENLEPGERSLVRKLSEYAETVERATNELMPHHICTYLYELAQTFNSFYEHNRVIGDERQAIRLKLVERYAETLKNGLELLGITAPDKM